MSTPSNTSAESTLPETQPDESNDQTSLPPGLSAEEIAKVNFDVFVQLAPDIVPFRVNTCILRYSKVLEETFEKIGAQDGVPLVPLHQDKAGVVAFVQFYHWATRDPRFSITKEGLSDLLMFVDKFDVPLLAREIISWTWDAFYEDTDDIDFSTKMIFSCYRFDFLADQLKGWIDAITTPETRAAVLAVFRSQEFKDQIGDAKLSDMIVKLVNFLEIHGPNIAVEGW